MADGRVEPIFHRPNRTPWSLLDHAHSGGTQSTSDGVGSGGPQEGLATVGAVGFGVGRITGRQDCIQALTIVTRRSRMGADIPPTRVER